jgi:glutathione peroxidase
VGVDFFFFIAHNQIASNKDPHKEASVATLDYTLEVTTLNGQTTTLADCEGHVLLIVNTASKCGLTPQYEGLQALHAQHADRGLKVLGFPCNQFGAQEPGNSEDIDRFCSINYGVDFAMFAKVDVNGRRTHPLFRQLKAAAPEKLGIKIIPWNFTKFLVARDGTILRRFAPTTVPADLNDAIVAELEK